jgi:NDP-sugar pyrophosphorylase family protein
MKKMKAVILAGGAGSRLQPITNEIPKPLLPVKKKPIINYLIELLRSHGVGDIGILVSRAHEEDFQRWQKQWGETLSPVALFYEETPRGTFGGLQQLQEWLGGSPFILSNADELKDFDLTSLMRFHEAHKPVGTIALVEVPDAHEYGVPVLEGDTIRAFLEKPQNPPSNFISSGLYVLEPEVFSHADFSKDKVMIETDVFPRLTKEGKLLGFKMQDARWFDCGNLERWEKAMKEW